MLDLHETIRVLHLIACPIVFICFPNRDWQGRVLKIIKSDHFFSIFNCLGPFLQVFGQVKEWLMLKFHKIRRVSHLFAYPIVLLLFYEREGQGGVLKVMKSDHFLVFLAVLVLFPKFLGRKRSDFC